MAKSRQACMPVWISNQQLKRNFSMAEYDFSSKTADVKGLTEKQIAYNAARAAEKAELQANLAEMFIPEIRPVPVDREYGGRVLPEAEHLALVAEAAELRAWLVKWFGLVSNDRLCHREQQSGRGRPTGALAVYESGQGYLQTKALGKMRLTHHLIWLLYYGRLPAPGMVIDHINGNKEDNRIENLREVSIQGNALNSSRNDDTLPHGLTRCTKHGGKSYYVRAGISIPAAIHTHGTPKQRTKNIRIAPWPKNEDGTPALGPDGQPLRNPDEIAAIATLAPLWRAWREELFGVPANL